MDRRSEAFRFTGIVHRARMYNHVRELNEPNVINGTVTKIGRAFGSTAWKLSASEKNK